MAAESTYNPLQGRAEAAAGDDALADKMRAKLPKPPPPVRLLKVGGSDK